MQSRVVLGTVVWLALLSLTAGSGVAQEPEPEAALAMAGTAFTYQGRLKDGSGWANGSYDLEFKLYDTLGGQVGSTVTKGNQAISDGYLTVQLDFGSGIFKTDALDLAIGVRPGISTGAYATLVPRQRLTPAPYALALPGLWTLQNATSPNTLGGYGGNSVTSGVAGAAIGGGGASGGANVVTDNYGTVGGGRFNQAGDDAGSAGDRAHATVGGGFGNQATNNYATVGGGAENQAAGTSSTAAGGYSNEATGHHSTIGGGAKNVAAGAGAVVGGGGSNGTTYSGNQAGAKASTVGGGYGNVISATGDFTVISGGTGNQASGYSAVIAGGDNNRATGGRAVVGGGVDNEAGGGYATICGGRSGLASGAGSFVGGGGYNGSTYSGNQAAATASSVVGGYQNSILDSASYATIGGGIGHQANAAGVFIGGGGYDGTNTVGHQAWGKASTIGGGLQNQTGMVADFATIGGGWSNWAIGQTSTVGGGHGNQAGSSTNSHSTVSGGEYNTASGDHATIGGGQNNQATEPHTTIGGGEDNQAKWTFATVAGGRSNQAIGPSSAIGGGYTNVASGFQGTIPGGGNNTAAGDHSFAAGYRAKANNDGCFVWGDATESDVPCNTNNRTIFRSSGGFYVYSAGNLGAGVYVPAGGGSWNTVSDRDAKQNLRPVDGREVLQRLAEIPISTWSYKTQPESIRHLGPMAQDLFAAFGLGESERHISTVDADGLALVSVQELYRLHLEQQAENTALRQQVSELETRLAALEQLVRNGGLTSVAGR